MKASSRYTISRMGLRLGWEAPKVDNLSVVLDGGLPRFFGHPRAIMDTLNTVLIGSFAICAILPVGRLTEIAEPVIGMIAVFMVYLMLRPFSGHIKPSKPVSRILAAINRNIHVPFGTLFGEPGTISYVDFWAWKCPMKKSSVGVIGKNFPQVFGGKRHSLILRDFGENFNAR